MSVFIGSLMVAYKKIRTFRLVDCIVVLCVTVLSRNAYWLIKQRGWINLRFTVRLRYEIQFVIRVFWQMDWVFRPDEELGDKIHLLRDPRQRTEHKQTKLELRETTGKECGMSSWTQFSLSSLVCGTCRMQQIRNTSWRFFLFYDRTIPEAQRTYQALAILVNWIWLLRPLGTIAFPEQRLCSQDLLYWARLGV
jgi:hypothetical protein